MQARTVKLSRTEFRNRPHITYYLGDVHEGAANHCDAAFKQAVDMIASDADAWIGLGDYVDAINHNDPRFNPQEISERYSIKDLEDLPKKQSDNFIKSITPIKDKCLGLIYGNHEDAYRRHNTFDCVNYMCERLGLENLRHKAWVNLAFYGGEDSNLAPIKIVVCHGSGGGGMREGYPVNKAYDVFRWDMADIHVMGHLHQMCADRAEYNHYAHNTMRSDKVWFGVNGCFLAKSTYGNDGYFEQRPGKESAIGLLKQTIFTGRTRADFKIKLEPIFID